MRSRRHLVVCALVLLLAAGSQQLAAQSTMISTVTQTLWTNFSPTGNDLSPTISNFGQSSHQLKFCATVNNGNISASLEGSADGGVNDPWSQIGETVLLTNTAGPVTDCRITEAGGYFPFVRGHITSKNGTVTAVNATYTAAGSPLPGSGLLNASPVTGVPSGSQPQGRSSTVVTSNPTGAINVLGLSNTPILVTSAILYGCHVFNPSASVVFFIFGAHTLSLPASANGFIAVLPNSAANCDLQTYGVSWGGNFDVVCSTSLTVLTAPASACQAVVYIKQFRQVNSNVSTNGTVNTQVVATPN